VLFRLPQQLKEDEACEVIRLPDQPLVVVSENGDERPINKHRLFVTFAHTDLLQETQEQVFTVGHIFLHQLLHDEDNTLQSLLPEKSEIKLDQLR